MDGKDVVLGAETGSGKTLAYLLPVLTRMLANKPVEGDGRPLWTDRRPRVLVLTPNQELAGQVLRVLDSLALGDDALGAVVAGAQGFPKGEMCKVMIATPSGVMRHTDPYLLALVDSVVVDEADFMLDGGDF
jgi:superfamily II DNA/RNA helicase